MSWLPFFSQHKRTSVVLIDADSGSVGGAYAHFATGKPPRIYFTARLRIDTTGERPTAADMLKTFSALTDTLVTAGAPILQRETGSGHIDQVFLSVGSPWQKTAVSVCTIEDKNGKEFVFTNNMIGDVRVPPKEPGMVAMETMIIATLLNGYETSHPFGKRAKRADLITLSSSIDEKVLSAIQTILKRAYHTHNITCTTFASLSYAVLRDMYPHEKDFIVIDFSGDTTDLAFVKGNLLVDVISVPLGTHAFSEAIRGTHRGTGVIDLTRNQAFGERIARLQSDWTNLLSNALKQFTKRHALPRTIFLIASQEARDFAKRLLDAPELHAIWLSDEPLRILPVLPSQFSSFVETRGSASGDVTLAMLALYHKKRLGG
jgi:hypothetical protein